ncbi:hypothetical protein J6590_103332 [Homalodisca vitripennis]|nr:hypothetical protein J6590_103332 [Homalodisca vitripennis]
MRKALLSDTGCALMFSPRDNQYSHSQALSNNLPGDQRLKVTSEPPPTAGQITRAACKDRIAQQSPIQAAATTLLELAIPLYTLPCANLLL